MGLDWSPIEFQTFYFSHVWLDPPNGHVGRDGDAVHSVTLEVGVDLDPLLLLGGEERLEVD